MPRIMNMPGFQIYQVSQYNEKRLTLEQATLIFEMLFFCNFLYLFDIDHILLKEPVILYLNKLLFHFLELSVMLLHFRIYRFFLSFNSQTMSKILLNVQNEVRY